MSKKFYFVREDVICIGMKVIIFNYIYELLRDMKYRVEVLVEIVEKVRKVIERMLEMS